MDTSSTPNWYSWLSGQFKISHINNQLIRTSNSIINIPIYEDINNHFLLGNYFPCFILLKGQHKPKREGIIIKLIHHNIEQLVYCVDKKQLDSYSKDLELKYKDFNIYY